MEDVSELGFLFLINKNTNKSHNRFAVGVADMNVLPADVMAEMGAKNVIAVDVAKEVNLEYYEYGNELSGLWLLWNSLNPFVQTVYALN